MNATQRRIELVFVAGSGDVRADVFTHQRDAALFDRLYVLRRNQYGRTVARIPSDDEIFGNVGRAFRVDAVDRADTPLSAKYSNSGIECFKPSSQLRSPKGKVVGRRSGRYP